MPFFRDTGFGFSANYFLEEKTAVQTTVWREVISGSLGRKKNIAKSSTKEKLDKEWIDLILTAKKMGLKVDQIRHFLQQSSPLIHSSKEQKKHR